jgi:hypothetical protein
MVTYRHSQFGTTTVWCLIVSMIIAGAVALSTAGHPLALVILLILLASLGLFYKLSVEVRPGEVVVAFGVGLIRKRIDLNDVRSARAVRNSWFYGWGIRMIPHGWMFNVSGLDAVELALANGRRFRIGTDEPQRLAVAIRQAAGLHESPAS